MAPKYGKAHPDERCTCCNRELYGHAIRLLELDMRTGRYSDDETIPAEHSQGWFPFGLKCARKLTKVERSSDPTRGRRDE